MPPWGIDPHVGLQSFKNDPSLREDEIDTIVKWVDAGAPHGQPRRHAEAARVRRLRSLAHRQARSDRHVAEARTLPAEAADWWGATTSTPASPKIATSRRSRRSRARRPSPTSYIRGHADHRTTRTATTTSEPATSSTSSRSGRTAISSPKAGRLLKAGSKIKFDFHYHSDRQRADRSVAVRIVFYPRRHQPKHDGLRSSLGTPHRPRHSGRRSTCAATATSALQKPALITAFQPHMHTRGKAQCIEVIYPDIRADSARPGPARTQISAA